MGKALVKAARAISELANLVRSDLGLPPTPPLTCRCRTRDGPLTVDEFETPWSLDPVGPPEEREATGPYHVRMARHQDTERIYQAQRVGVFARLTTQEQVNELEAEHLIAQWEHEAEAAGRAKGSPRYWDDAWTWIEDKRKPPTIDKTDMSAEGDDGQVYGG